MGDDDHGAQPPGAAPNRTGRRHGNGALPRIVGIVLIAVLAGGGVVLAGRAGADGPAGGAGQPRPASVPASAASPEPTATPPPAADTPGPLTPDSQLSPIGLGPVEVGMTVAEAERAGGVTLAPWGDRFGDCWLVAPEGWPSANDDEDPGGDPPVSFMVVGDRITRVDVAAGGTATAEGIRIGSTEQDVQDAYPGQVTATTDRVGQRLLIYIPPELHRDSARGTIVFYGIVVFTSDGRQVTGIRAGHLGDVVLRDEGCA